MKEYDIEEVQELLKANKIELVNCKSLGKMFWRYIPLSRLEEMLIKKELAFIHPKLWNDPFETLYLGAKFNSKKKSTSKLYCLCGRGNGNEDASWKVYSDGVEPLVCVQFNLKKLLPLIKDYADKNKCKVYYSKVSYELTTQEIKDILTKNTLTRKYFKKYDEKEYIRLLSFKRQSFKYEEEYRIFVVPQEGQKSKVKEDLLWIPINCEIFNRFTLQPKKRIMKDKGKLYYRIKAAEYNLLRKKVEDFTKMHAPSVQFCCSTLYNEV